MKKLFYFVVSSFSALILTTGVFSCSNEDEPWAEEEYCSLSKRRITRAYMEGPQSPPYNYPTKEDIRNNSIVEEHMKSLWEQTKAAASEFGRAEKGCYICYNRQTLSYYFIDFDGPIQSGPSQASIIFPASNDSNICAAFHTHTTLQYLDTTYIRLTGPSRTDLQGNLAATMPCFVYDYAAPSIKGGESKDSLAKIYPYGTNRREL